MKTKWIIASVCLLAFAVTTRTSVELALGPRSAAAGPNLQFGNGGVRLKIDFGARLFFDDSLFARFGKEAAQ